MMDPDDKFLMDLNGNGKEKGLKTLNAGVTVTTPQGTVPLEEYGSFQPQFTPMFNRGEILGWNMSDNRGNGECNPEDEGSLTSPCREITAKGLKNELAHPNELSVEFSAATQTGSEVDQFAKKFYFHEFTEEEKQAWIKEGKESDQRFIEEMNYAFHVPQSYIDSMPQYDPQTKEVIVHKPRAMGKTIPVSPNNQLLGRLKRHISHDELNTVIMTPRNRAERAEAEMEVTKKIVNPKHQIRYKMPLPSLEAINANIKLAWSTWYLAKRRHEQAMKDFEMELSRMSDVQLRVALNMLRVQAHSILGKQTRPNPVATEKYLLALEETNQRRDRYAAQRNAIDH